MYRAGSGLPRGVGLSGVAVKAQHRAGGRI